MHMPSEPAARRSGGVKGIAVMTDKQRLALLNKAIKNLRDTTQGFDTFAASGKGSAWRAAFAALDQLAGDLEITAPEPVLKLAIVGHSHLGPVLAGHKGVCDNDLTHATSGFAFHPAFDDMSPAGAAVLAPEDMTITKWGSAKGGESIHASGISGIHWWFGHIDDRAAVGTKVKQGKKFASVSSEHEHPHVHVGIDARALIGRELFHHTNYTHGAPTVCKQLGG